MMSDVRVYNLDDEVGIYIGRGNNDRVKGVVVAKFGLPNRSAFYYVISVETVMDELLEIRSGHFLEMQPWKDIPIEQKEEYQLGWSKGVEDGKKMMAEEIAHKLNYPNQDELWC